jgi:hypothetical protein
MRKSLVFALLLLLSACATWEKVEGDKAAIIIKDKYSLTAPEGWVRAPYMAGDVFLSRDGPLLNTITANEVVHDKALLPQDFAELLIAELRSGSATSNLEVVSNKPALIDNQTAIRLDVRWKNDRGLPIERLIYATLTPKGRLLLIYEAPGLVYFPKGLADFESMIKSVRLLGGSS